MRVTTLLLAALAAALTPWQALGADVPVGTKSDQRIKYVMYDPDDVVVIRTREGNTTLIQLEPGEFLTGSEGALSIGDEKAWTVGVKQNNIFLKPKAKFPNTNINLVTNRRTYALSLVETTDINQAAWQVRFKYPAVPVSDAGLGGSKGARHGLCEDGPKNFNWFKYGDEVLAPTEVWDDGRFTCLRFPTSKALPVVYRYTPTGDLKEALINFSIHDDVLVVHEVSSEFRLRMGNKVLGLKTDSLRDAPFNTNKTTTGEVRVRLDGK